MARITLFVLVFAVALCGCDKKKKAPEPPPTTTAQKPEPKKTPAPAGIPQSLKDKLDTEWPEIKAKGEEFVAKFEEAQKAQNSGDRTAMNTAINEASELYGEAAEQWAEFENWINDQEDDGKMTADEAERCRRFLSTYERTVKDWRKKAKALKEFMTVK